MKALADGVEHCRNLKMLNLESNYIGNCGAAELSVGLGYCSNFETLNFRCNCIYSQDIAARKGLMKLIAFDCSCNEIGIASQALIDALTSKSNLKVLAAKLLLMV